MQLFAMMLLDVATGGIQSVVDPTSDPSEVEPGWWNTVVVLSIIAVTVALCISMFRRVRRVDARARRDHDDAD